MTSKKFMWNYTLSFICLYIIGTINAFIEIKNNVKGREVANLKNKRESIPYGCNISSCFSWCEEDVNVEIKNSETGKVIFQLPASPDCCYHESYSVEVLVNEKSCNKIPGSLHFLSESHSKYDVKKSPLSDIQLKVLYAFSGCYQLAIRPRTISGTGQKCYTKLFDVETMYRKKTLAGLETNVSCTYKPKKKNLDILITFERVFTGDDSLPESLCIRLNSGIDLLQKDCSETGKKQSCCEMGKQLSLCKDQQYSKEDCSCQWKLGNVICKFENINEGNYCIHLEFDDVRCGPGTVWDQENSEKHYCKWHQVCEANSFNESSVIVTYSTQRDNFKWIIMTFALLFFLIVIIVTIYFKTLPKHLKNEYEPPSIQKPKKKEKKHRVFLLYPKDCKEFMIVMEKLRFILINYLKTEVFDLWDLDQWEVIANRGEFWALDLISKSDVKIILIATKCSRLMEKALVDGKKVSYTDPRFMDLIFLSALRSIKEFCAESMYSRVSVVRLRGKDCEENKFLFINPRTVYTIPDHLQVLSSEINNLIDADGTPLLLKEEKSLVSALEVYNNFKENNPFYLEQMLQVEETCY